MIRFEVTGNDVHDFRANFAAVLGVFLPLLKPAAQPGTAAPPATPPADTKVVDVKATVVAEEPPKEKPRAAAKDKKQAEPKISIEDLRAKLKALGEAKSHDAVFKLLDEYKVKKASEVPAEKYAEIIAKVDDLLNAEG